MLSGSFNKEKRLVAIVKKKGTFFIFQKVLGGKNGQVVRGTEVGDESFIYLFTVNFQKIINE